MACLVAGASNRRRGAATADRREERYKLVPKFFNAQGGWHVSFVVVVVVVDVVDLVVGRARRAAAAAAARKCLKRVHEAEARRVEDAILGRPFEILFFGVARVPRLAQIDLRALRAGGLPVERRFVLGEAGDLTGGEAERENELVHRD